MSQTHTFDATQTWGFNRESARVIATWGSGTIPKTAGTKEEAQKFASENGFVLTEKEDSFDFDTPKYSQ